MRFSTSASALPIIFAGLVASAPHSNVTSAMASETLLPASTGLYAGFSTNLTAIKLTSNHSTNLTTSLTTNLTNSSHAGFQALAANPIKAVNSYPSTLQGVGPDYAGQGENTQHNSPWPVEDWPGIYGPDAVSPAQPISPRPPVNPDGTTGSWIFGVHLNCGGVFLCKLSLGRLSEIIARTALLSPSNWYGKGQHIACDRNVCCYFDGRTRGGTAEEALMLMDLMRRYSCQKCGRAFKSLIGKGLVDRVVDDSSQLRCQWVVLPGNNGS